MSQYDRHRAGAEGEPTLPERDETTAERADRNWLELLQELRVIQTGTQILTGFLLAVAFQPAFADLTSGQRTFYLCLIVLSALSSIVALAPAALHRVLFRQGAKPELVSLGHVCLIVSLTTVSLLVVSVVAFVFEVVLGEASLLWVIAPLVAVLLGLWVLLPVMMRIRMRRKESS